MRSDSISLPGVQSGSLLSGESGSPSASAAPTTGVRSLSPSLFHLKILKKNKGLVVIQKVGKYIFHKRVTCILKIFLAQKQRRKHFTVFISEHQGDVEDGQI